MADLFRVSIFGTMPSGEEWSVNPVWGITGGPKPVTAAQAQAVATALAAVGVNATLRAAWTTSTFLTGIRVEARTLAGVLEAQAESLLVAPSAGTGAVAHPFQTSWVTSLRTPNPGQSYRGRLYWPATGVGLSNATLRPTIPTAANFIVGVAAYLAALQTAFTAPFGLTYLSVWSRKLNSQLAVTSVQAGDVLDVQRRRRDTLVENYSSSNYLP